MRFDGVWAGDGARRHTRSRSPLVATCAMGQSVRMTAPFATSPFRFEGNVAHLARDWSITSAEAPPGPPRRIDGYTIGVASGMRGPGPHRGEMHPDGDEFLYVVSGEMTLVLDDGDEHAAGAEMIVQLAAGDAYIVPRGQWHRLEAIETSCLVHVTPGPTGGHRPR